MKNAEFIKDLKNYIKARYPLIFIETTEEDRLIADLRRVGEELKYNLTTWSPVESFECATYNLSKKNDVSCLTFEEILFECNNTIADTGKPFLFTFFGADINKEARILKKIAENIRKENKFCCSYIFIAPSFENLDKSIYSEAIILDYPLLDKQEIKEKILEILFSWTKMYKDKIQIEEGKNLVETLSNASLGLTSIEIENCLAKTLVKNEGYISEECARDIIKEKKQIIRKSGVLEYIDNNLSLEDIGGLDILKNWLNLRKNTFWEEAQDFGLTPPKGVLLVGIPGCGKSLTAKCIASSWNMPLLKCDIGKIFGKYIGESEENMRTALKVAEATAPCVLWIDEIEKGLKTGEQSHEITTRVFGSILSWMQDKTEPVFVFATANNIRNLPPELLRKGRFDEIFFVDLPNFEERKRILEIHISKIGRDIHNFDIDALAQISGEAYLGENICLSGAEIEAWIKDALMEAYARKINGDLQADLSMDDLIKVFKRIIPMAKMRKMEFKELRNWAQQNAVNASLNDFFNDTL
ncbi:MAG: AAA family ATPase [Alphaproteobacteria bacterium]|nr:AAA family ATPase [Alphaproteobacteria bacterium]